MEANQPLQRTQQIRRRRTQQTREIKQKQDRRKRKVVARTSPPVMARNQVFGVTIAERQPARKTRRRYDVRLDEQGTELSLPAIPRLRVGWRFASVVVSVFFGLALYHIWNSPTYRVEAAEVNGLKIMGKSEINNALGLSNDQVFSLDADLMRQELLDGFPELKAVSVEIDLPNTVAVSVTERIPVLVWRRGEQSLLLDAEGMAFPNRGGAVPTNCPVVEAKSDPPPLGFTDPISDTLDTLVAAANDEAMYGEATLAEATPLLSQDMVFAYLLLSQKLPKGAQLVYDPEHGIGWADRREWFVYFGNAEDIETKLSIYNMMLENIKALEVRPKMISVEYVHAPYYRLEP
jgi:cell division protein FtsQ